MNVVDIAPARSVSWLYLGGIGALCVLSATLAACVSPVAQLNADTAAIQSYFLDVRNLYAESVEKALVQEAKTQYPAMTLDQYMACRFGPDPHSIEELQAQKFVEERTYSNLRPDPHWVPSSGVRPGDAGFRVYLAEFVGRMQYEGTTVPDVTSEGHVGIHDDGRVIAFLDCAKDQSGAARQ